MEKQAVDGSIISYHPIGFNFFGTASNRFYKKGTQISGCQAEYDAR